MQYMLIFNEPAGEFAKREDADAAPAYWAAWRSYVDEIREAGVVVNGDGLQPPSTATHVSVRDGKRLVQDGPYADTHEHLGGYFVIEVPTLDVALDWAAKSPSSAVGHTEVRPVLPPPPPDAESAAR